MPFQPEPGEFYAHTADDCPWEQLFTPFGLDQEKQCQGLGGEGCEKCRNLAPDHGHLNKVAFWCAQFAAGMFPPGPAREAARTWGWLAGLWHDLGKYHPQFQERIRGALLQIEHAGAGAELASENRSGHYFSFVIAGHHTGLFNHKAGLEGARLQPFERRMESGRRHLEECRADGRIPLELEHPNIKLASPPWIQANLTKQESGITSSFLTRMLFAALVDADSIATERFCQPDTLRTSQEFTSIAELRTMLDRSIDEKTAAAPDSRVNRQRQAVLACCREAAERSAGFFSLTVPTGGGKTLSAMSFALRHADRHGMRRVIVAIPFTSIIEQNANVYSGVLGGSNVLEHHCSIDDFADVDAGEPAAIRRRLAAENWPAPVIVTTNVQLLESLHANKRSRCRRLHNIARSVIILDEAQCLPAALLNPALAALRELVEHYGCSVVLSSATQPALRWRPRLPFGIKALHDKEIIRGATTPDSLFENLRRVRWHWPEFETPEPWDSLADRMTAAGSCLAIVHRKDDARQLYQELTKRTDEPVFHLSTFMCPVHRRVVLWRIRRALKKARAGGPKCRVISTNLIEAGVDVDFPTVFRALAGVDSLIQAAGRCNREGRLEFGDVFLFHAPTEPPPGLLRQGLAVTKKLTRECGGKLDLDDPATTTRWFEEFYSLCDPDQHKVLYNCERWNFESAAGAFRLIEELPTVPIVVALDRRARHRIDLAQEAIRLSLPAVRRRLRALQPYVIQVHMWVADEITKALENIAGDLPDGEPLYLLDPKCHDLLYSMAFGLNREAADMPSTPQALVVST